MFSVMRVVIIVTALSLQNTGYLQEQSDHSDRCKPRTCSGKQTRVRRLWATILVLGKVFFLTKSPLKCTCVIIQLIYSTQYIKDYYQMSFIWANPGQPRPLFVYFLFLTMWNQTRIGWTLVGRSILQTTTMGPKSCSVCKSFPVDLRQMYPQIQMKLEPLSPAR